MKPDITDSLNTGITRREYPHTPGEEKTGISPNEWERDSTHFIVGTSSSGSPARVPPGYAGAAVNSAGN
jgi:hypothetical protein